MVVCCPGTRFFEAPRFARGDRHDRVVEQAIEHGGGGAGDGQEGAPVLEWPVAGQADAASLVRASHDSEQQLCARLVQRCEANLVDQNDVVAQQSIDDAADGVVGQPTVELLDQVGSAGVAHA